MTTMLERAARAAGGVAATTVDDVRHLLSDRALEDVARAVLMAVREPDDAFMGALYPDPESIVADRGRAAGMRSRRAGRMQIAHFIDAILNGKDTTND